MAKREEQLFDNLDGSVVSWQYSQNYPAEHERQQSHMQANHNTGGTCMLLCILFTIGFITLLAIKTILSLL